MYSRAALGAYADEQRRFWLRQFYRGCRGYYDANLDDIGRRVNSPVL